MADNLTTTKLSLCAHEGAQLQALKDLEPELGNAVRLASITHSSIDEMIGDCAERRGDYWQITLTHDQREDLDFLACHLQDAINELSRKYYAIIEAEAPDKAA